MLFVSVPPYRDPTISDVAKVNFYVVNGKKRRSQPQHFIYTPLKGKPTTSLAVTPRTNKALTQGGYTVIIYWIYCYLGNKKLYIYKMMRMMSVNIIICVIIFGFIIKTYFFCFFSITAIKTEPFTNYDVYGCVDPQAFDPPQRSLHHHTNNLLPILYHVTNHVPAATHESVPPYNEEDELLFYPSKSIPSQLYHAWNQHQADPTGSCFPVQRHNNAGPHQRHLCSLGVPHLSNHHPSNPAHCLDNGASLCDKLPRGGESYRAVATATAALPDGSDPFGATCLVAPRLQGYSHTAGLLGKSPPTLSSSSLSLSCAQRRDADKMCVSRPELCGHPPPTQRGEVGTGRPWNDVALERGVKQEHPVQVCLEDGE